MGRIARHPASLRLAAALVVVLVAAGVVAVVTASEGTPPLGAGRLRASGDAEVVGIDGGVQAVQGIATLNEGDVVRAVTGTFLIELPGGAAVEGRATDDGATRLRVAPEVELLSGDLLVEAKQPARFLVAGNRVAVQPDGDDPAAVRLNRSYVTGAGAYRGTLTIDSAGRTRQVAPLREVSVSSLGRLPAPRALQVDGADAWDRRFLGEAIDAGDRLEDTSRAYTSTLRSGEGRTAAFYRERLPLVASEVSFDDALLDGGGTPGGLNGSASTDPAPTSTPPGDVLVGAAIAALGEGGTFAERWQEVFRFRSDGPRPTSWGLVALDQGVDPAVVLRTVQDAVERTSFEFAAVTPSTSPPRATPADPPGAPAPPSTSDPVPPARPGPAPSIPTTGTTSTTPAAPPTTARRDPLSGLLEAVGELLGGLLGAR